uniref:Ovule protein n=1 Tax=Heterorhabditis bacteriophora TaxID=37862 RepID=A0A1I7W8D6_HETBA
MYHSTFSESTSKAFLRITAIVEQRTEFGRMVLLLCKKNCSRLRSQMVTSTNFNFKVHFFIHDAIMTRLNQ